VIRRAAGGYVVNELTSGGDVRDAAHSSWLIGTTLLAEVAWAALLYGLVLLVGAWLAGPSRLATTARARMAPMLVERPGLSWTMAAAAYLLVVWWGPTPALQRPLGVLVLGILGAAGFVLLRHIVATERRTLATTPDVPAQASRVQGVEVSSGPTA